MQQPTATIESSIDVWTDTDRRLMARALELAAKGVGQVSPGPLVGCVLATAEGRVLGEGFYLYEQLKHAETYALEQAGSSARGATAYVSLEPHAHHGRTSPCTDALISAGVKRVLSPTEDPNPKVSGRGFAHLRSSGIEVSVGLLASEAERLNEKYHHFMRTGRPFVHLKLAASLDGKIATRTGASRWITGPESRERVHNLRHEYDAILVGSGTASTDDPLLTDRSGQPRRTPLLRIVLDEKLDISTDGQLARTAKEAPLLVFAGGTVEPSKLSDLESLGVEVVQDESGGRDLEMILETLARRPVQSVLVEGGASVAGKLLDARLIDKVTFFVAPIIIGGRDARVAVAGAGAETLAEALELKDVQITQRGRDFEVTGYPKVRG